MARTSRKNVIQLSPESKIYCAAAYVRLSVSKPTGQNDSIENQKSIQSNADIVNRMTYPKRYTTSSQKICEIGDIIMSVRAPVGMVARTSIGTALSAVSEERTKLDDTHKALWQMFDGISKNETSVNLGNNAIETNIHRLIGKKFPV
ncbi:MAG: hypothetical protein VB060_12030 [Oscillibacter sp.]|nr:hypothetical protein [Oscillibacter sp.]MEA4994526.1 hypothetical protein [Oscillibacter sp.]